MCILMIQTGIKLRQKSVACEQVFNSSCGMMAFRAVFLVRRMVFVWQILFFDGFLLSGSIFFGKQLIHSIIKRIMSGIK